MASDASGPGARREPLQRLRRRLTAWYALTFCAILLLLGGGLFVAIREQLTRQLDDDVRAATGELIRAARIRELEAGASHGTVVDAVEELHIPDRTLYLLDARTGAPVTPAVAPPWVRDAARGAARDGRVDVEREDAHERSLHLHAERFTLRSGTALVAAVVADRVELEDRYAALIAAFGGAAVVAVVLVAAGGWLLARKSAEPVEHSIAQMERFMADAAHELRTPIAVLRSRAEVALQRPREPEAYVAALRGVEAESERLGRIVEDLLTLARADAGARPIARERLFLDDIAADAASAAGSLAAGRGVTVTLDEFDEAAVEGDAALLRQLAMIVLDNAVKFTQRGGEVRVRVGTIDARPTLSIEDTGVGVAPDELPFIFDRFWRGDPARTRVAAPPVARGGEGAGLGLAIARWIADAHHAQIAVDSTPGRGTRVVIGFPPAARAEG